MAANVDNTDNNKKLKEKERTVRRNNKEHYLADWPQIFNGPLLDAVDLEQMAVFKTVVA